jgi:hypothetical protein
MGITLFDIDSAYQDTLNKCCASAEENQGVIEPNLALQLEAVEMQRDVKIENTLKFYKNENAIALMLETEIDTLQRRLKTHANNANFGKSLLLAVVKPGEKIEYGCGRISWRESTSANVTDFQRLPEEYKRVVPERKEPDKIAIKAALVAGKVVDGAELVKSNNIQLK